MAHEKLHDLDTFYRWSRGLTCSIVERQFILQLLKVWSKYIENT